MKKQAKKMQQTNAEQYKPEHRPAGGGVFVRNDNGIKEQLEGPGKNEFNQDKKVIETGAQS